MRPLAALLLGTTACAAEPSLRLVLDEPSDGEVVRTDAKCPGSNALRLLLLTSESNTKGWNGERPKAGYGLKSASQNTFEIDWVRAWQRSR